MRATIAPCEPTFTFCMLIPHLDNFTPPSVTFYGSLARPSGRLNSSRWKPLTFSRGSGAFQALRKKAIAIRNGFSHGPLCLVLTQTLHPSRLHVRFADLPPLPVKGAAQSR